MSTDTVKSNRFIGMQTTTQGHCTVYLKVSHIPGDTANHLEVMGKHVMDFLSSGTEAWNEIYSKIIFIHLGKMLLLDIHHEVFTKLSKLTFPSYLLMRTKLSLKKQIIHVGTKT